MTLIGRIICIFKGHKRGKLVRTEGGEGTGMLLCRVLACPRCGREKRYPPKSLAVATPEPKA